ncbi:MAG TPA: hypothetical protein VEJ63_03290 [Planctomycetota bacterium]|nr:hypothetical protein [Planctomycetota bacterium]
MIRATIIPAAIFTLHLIVVPSYSSFRQSEPFAADLQTMIAMQILMITYAAFPVALFWDLTGKPKAAAPEINSEQKSLTTPSGEV